MLPLREQQAGKEEEIAQNLIRCQPLMSCPCAIVPLNEFRREKNPSPVLFEGP